MDPSPENSSSSASQCASQILQLPLAKAEKKRVPEAFPEGHVLCQVIDKPLEGKTILNHYKINEKVEAHKHCSKWRLTNLNQPDQPLLLKISADHDQWLNEIEAGHKMDTGSFPLAPNVNNQQAHSFGLFYFRSAEESEAIDQKILSKLHSRGLLNQFVLLPDPGLNLASYLREERTISELSAFDLGIKVLDEIRRVHRAGFAYNLLDPERIYLRPDSQASCPKTELKSCFQSFDLTLSDFSGCTPLPPRLNRIHTSHAQLLTSSNPIYASSHFLKGETTGRRDDLISLFYLLVVLLNQGRFMQVSESAALKMGSQHILRYKLRHSLKDLCSGPSACLKKLMVVIFALDVKEEPPYLDIKKTLIRLKQEALEKATLLVPKRLSKKISPKRMSDIRQDVACLRIKEESESETSDSGSQKAEGTCRSVALFPATYNSISSPFDIEGGAGKEEAFVVGDMSEKKKPSESSTCWSPLTAIAARLLTRIAQ